MSSPTQISDRKRRQYGVPEKQFDKLVETDPILSLRQAAIAAGRCDMTLRRAIWSGELKALRRGPVGHLFIRWSDLQRWLAGQETTYQKLAL